MLIEPNPTNVCFGCGGANARGMKLTFEQDDAARRIIGRFRLGAEYQGAFGIIHGGVIAVVARLYFWATRSRVAGQVG